MTKKTTELVERIPLSAPNSLSPNQQGLYDAINEQAAPWVEESGFIAKLEDGSLIGPFNVALQSPEIGAAFWQLQGIEAKNTTLNERVGAEARFASVTSFFSPAPKLGRSYWRFPKRECRKGFFERLTKERAD